MHAGRWRAWGFLILCGSPSPHTRIHTGGAFSRTSAIFISKEAPWRKTFLGKFPRVEDSWKFSPPPSPVPKPTTQKPLELPYDSSSPRIWLYPYGYPYCSFSSVAPRSFLSNILKLTRHLLLPSCTVTLGAFRIPRPPHRPFFPRPFVTSPTSRPSLQGLSPNLPGCDFFEDTTRKDRITRRVMYTPKT